MRVWQSRRHIFCLFTAPPPFQVLNSDSGEMRELLKSTLLDRRGKIQWARLEELVSIAGAAKVSPFALSSCAFELCADKQRLFSRVFVA
jgi:hypothetical protein